MILTMLPRLPLPLFFGPTNCSGVDATEQLDCLRAVPAYTLSDLALVSYDLCFRRLVKDGTYLTTDSLRLDKSAPVANVHLMLGGMRDDGVSFLQYPTTTNLSLEISKLTVALPTSEVLASGAFPLPSAQTPHLTSPT
jgi:hypothetical protein